MADNSIMAAGVGAWAGLEVMRRQRAKVVIGDAAWRIAANDAPLRPAIRIMPFVPNHGLAVGELGAQGFYLASLRINDVS